MIVLRQEITPDIVKSAARTFQILEYFDVIQREANVVEISLQLGYPQSSTSVLLRSLVKLGYLDYNARSRKYVSSIRVALLGSWVNAHCVGEGKILQAMRELSQRTGDTIVLAARNNLYAQYINVIQAINAARLHIAVGTVRPIASSASGSVILALLSDEEVSGIVRRVNAETGDETKRVDPKELLLRLAKVREDGYFFGSNMVTPGGAMMIAPIPISSGPTQLFLGLAGIAQVMEQNREKLANHLIETIEMYFGAHPKTVYRSPRTTGKI